MAVVKKLMLWLSGRNREHIAGAYTMYHR